MRGTLGAILLGVTTVTASSPAWAQDPFTYHDPGDLIPGSGTGLEEWKVFAPGMRFPMTDGPAYANSQVYMHGGYLGPGGAQCDAENYSYPWRDNYCETRSWSMPLCPSGTGHQGQDIRPATCDDSAHGLAAAAAGTITNIGSYSVYLTGGDGTRYDFLHGSDISVAYGQNVVPGEPIGKVSNEFGGGSTTIHLHFNIKQDVGGVGFVYVSPYMSLVESYEALMGLTNEPPQGELDGTDCVAITGWAHDPDLVDAPVTVRVNLDGDVDDPESIVLELIADEYREDLCDALGSCEHGFVLEAPRALKDGLAHDVHAYALDDEGGDNVELAASPLAFVCPPPTLPEGIRRPVPSPEVLAAWEFSPLWDLANVDEASLDAIPLGAAIADAPLLVSSDDEPDLVWLVDRGLRRRVDGEAVMEAWRFDPESVQVWPAASVAGIEQGTAVWPAPFLVKGEGPEIYLLDDEQCTDGCQPDDDGGGTSTSESGDDPFPPDFGGEDASGCGCTSAPAPGWPAWAGWLLLIPLAARRRHASWWASR